MITQNRLKKVLHYDPGSGVFTWTADKRKVKPGMVAGNIRKDGYVLIRVDYKRYYAHRLAWLYMYGQWPKEEIDHANGDPSDNRISNIRLANRQQNAANLPVPRNNTSGAKGVHWKGSSWVAQIQYKSEWIYLGSYKNKEMARAAYESASKVLNGEYSLFSREPT